jgi:hypothetical protein
MCGRRLRWAIRRSRGRGFGGWAGGWRNSGGLCRITRICSAVTVVISITRPPRNIIPIILVSVVAIKVVDYRVSIAVVLELRRHIDFTVAAKFWAIEPSECQVCKFTATPARTLVPVLAFFVRIGIEEGIGLGIELAIGNIAAKLLLTCTYN